MRRRARRRGGRYQLLQQQCRRPRRAAPGRARVEIAQHERGAGARGKLGRLVERHEQRVSACLRRAPTERLRKSAYAPATAMRRRTPHSRDCTCRREPARTTRPPAASARNAGSRSARARRRASALALDLRARPPSTSLAQRRQRVGRHSLSRARSAAIRALDRAFPRHAASNSQAVRFPMPENGPSAKSDACAMSPCAAGERVQSEKRLRVRTRYRRTPGSCTHGRGGARFEQHPQRHRTTREDRGRSPQRAADRAPSTARRRFVGHGLRHRASPRGRR